MKSVVLDNPAAKVLASAYNQERDPLMVFDAWPHLTFAFGRYFESAG